MTKEIPLTQGKFAIVDDNDFEWINKWKWHYIKGYAVRTISSTFKKIYMHREINKTPEGLYTDHIDQNKLNNTRSNLRTCNLQENDRNRKKQKNNTSGYKGVCYAKDRGKWRSRIKVNSVYFWIGNFNNAKDAAAAYNDKAKELFGEFACLNIIS
jgi:hypothetical protein